MDEAVDMEFELAHHPPPASHVLQNGRLSQAAEILRDGNMGRTGDNLPNGDTIPNDAPVHDEAIPNGDLLRPAEASTLQPGAADARHADRVETNGLRRLSKQARRRRNRRMRRTIGDEAAASTIPQGNLSTDLPTAPTTDDAAAALRVQLEQFVQRNHELEAQAGALEEQVAGLQERNMQLEINQSRLSAA